jgi:hypothetical protein
MHGNDYKPGPLRTKFLEIGDIIKLTGEPFTVLDENPAGRKDGNYLDCMCLHHKVDIDRWSNMIQECRDSREKILIGQR